MNWVIGVAAKSKRRAAPTHYGVLLAVARVAFAFALAAQFCPLAAQNPMRESGPATAATESEPQSATQQAGAAAQLRAGTSSGPDSEARMQNLLADHQYLRMQAELGDLPSDQAQFYRGILANRTNQLEQSDQLLEPLVDQVTASGDKTREKLLRMTLAEDYLRQGDWAKAGQAFRAIDDRLRGALSSGEQDEIEMPLKVLPLVKGNPPITADPCGPFRLQVSTNPLGLIDVPVFIDSRSYHWMLDPTSQFNLISRSIAQDLGLEISKDSATIRTLTGRPIQVHGTVIPSSTIGGRLTLHNLIALVFDDGDYAFKSAGYRVEGVLGYPTVAAMGRITVSNNTIEVDPAKQDGPNESADRLTTGAQFYLDGDQIIVALGRAQAPAPDSAASDSPAQGISAGGHGDSARSDEQMFSIDAGGQQTYLTSRWFNEHAAEFTGKKMEPFTFPDTDSEPRSAYVAENVPLVVGDTAIELHNVPVLTQPLGSAARDDVYGVIGIDGLDQLTSYTFDYRTMRFSASAE
jgi:Aspartyl protease